VYWKRPYAATCADVNPAPPLHGFRLPRATVSRLLLAGTVLLIAACAPRPPQPPSLSEAAWLAHRASVEALTGWQVQGRVAIRSEDDGWHATFDWQQRGDAYRLRLRGPFGQGAVELRGDDSGVWLQRQDRAPVFARSVDQLLQEETGWLLPVSGLQDWLLGVPVDGRPAVLGWDERGLLQSLQQAGWQIDYRRYQAVGGQHLPDRLRLVRDALQVKVVVDEWQLP